jgi:hypothetical protein
MIDRFMNWALTFPAPIGFTLFLSVALSVLSVCSVIVILSVFYVWPLYVIGGAAFAWLSFCWIYAVWDINK